MSNGEGKITFAVYCDIRESGIGGATSIYSKDSAINRPELSISTATKDIPSPSEVTTINAISKNGAIRLVWSDPKENDFASVNIYNSNGFIQTVAKGEQNLLISSLTNETQYNFTLKTVDLYGNESVGADILGSPSDTPIDTIPPQNVSNPTANGSDSKISLTWTEPNDIDFKNVKITCNNTSIFVSKGIQTAIINGLSNNVQYNVGIQTIDYDGNISSIQNISAKTTGAYEAVLDSFDGTSKFPGMCFVMGNTPDRSQQYAQFASNAVLTYKRIALVSSEILSFGATGFKIWLKTDVPTVEDSQIYFEIRENGDEARYSTNIALDVKSDQWTEFYIPFTAFQRSSGGTSTISTSTFFDINKVTEMRIFLNPPTGTTNPITLSLDNLRYAVNLPTVGNLNISGSDSRAVLSWKDPLNITFDHINIYNNLNLIAEVAKNTEFKVISNLTNGDKANISVTTCDSQGRESSTLSKSINIQNNGFSIDSTVFQDVYGNNINNFMPMQVVNANIVVINDLMEDAPLTLYTAFYDSNHQLQDICVNSFALPSKGANLVKFTKTITKRAEYAKVFTWSNVLLPYKRNSVYPSPTNVNFSVSNLFASGMVLQRDKPISIWGTANTDDIITVSFKGETVSTKAQAGKWKVLLPAFSADKTSATLTVSCQNETSTFSDILVGDVWLASGQSNMAFQLSRVVGGQSAIDNANNNNIRFFTHTVSSTVDKQNNVINPRWFPAIGTNTYFKSLPSAVAYFFADEVYKNIDVPIGIIQTPLSGSSMQAWTRYDLLMSLPYSIRGASYNLPKNYFSGLYNGSLYPFTNATIKGVIWYQGEANTSIGFAQMFENLVTNWRNDFRNQNLPFIYMNLPICGVTTGDYDLALKREQQYLASISIPNVGMASLLEKGDKYDVHPLDKEPVGRRFGTIALEKAYNWNIDSSSPTYESFSVSGSDMYLHFNHTGTGLIADGNDPLSGFEIAGADGIFYKATAEISSPDTVKISSPNVYIPTKTRYAWGDTPETINYKNISLVDNAFILTYDSISPRFNIGDYISGFKIQPNSTGTAISGYANAQMISTNQIKVWADNTTLSPTDSAIYAFLDFPFKTANLSNSLGYTAVPFRTYQ